VFRALVGKEAEVFRGPDRRFCHEAMSLPGIDTFEHGDVVGVILDGVSYAVQQLAPHRSANIAPGLEGEAGCGRGAVDVFGVAARDACEQCAVDRRPGLELSAGNRRHALAADHMRDAFGFQLREQGRGTIEVGLEQV
jgi:hypothetical protein